MTQIPENPFVLVDGTSYLYRAYHAFPPLINRAGEVTGAMYGVLSMLRSLIMQYQPTHAAIVFDAKGKTFRDELFKNYKSHRPPIPENLRVQINPLYKMIKAMGLPLLIVPGVEADDVIGTLAYQAQKIGYPVLISTSDKDMAQLVTPGITLINTMNNTILGPKEVVKRYGVPPELFIDFLALMGDSSDNIPGVPGVGEKTAKALLQEIGGLDSIYNQLNKVIELKVRGAKTITTKLEKNKEIAYLSYQLATIRTDLKLDLAHEELIIQRPIVNELVNLFKKYEFQRWIIEVKTGNWLKTKAILPIRNGDKNFLIHKQEHKQEKKKVTTFFSKNYEILLEESQLVLWIEKLKKVPIFAINVETNSVNNISANLIALSFSIKPGIAAYIPLDHKYLKGMNQISCDRALELLKPILENDNILKVGWNLKFDCSVLQHYDIELRGIAFDTMLESYVLEKMPKHRRISPFVVRGLKNKNISSEEIPKKGKNQLTFDQIPIKEMGYHAAEASSVTLQLHLKMWPKLQKHKRLLKIFKNIEMPLVPILSRIEQNGVKIDASLLHKHSKKIALRLNELEQKACDIAGESFNLASTKQLQIILFTKQGIQPFKKTPSGRSSTSEEVLKKLALDYPLPKVVLEYRKLAKLKSTYIDKLPLMINPKTGRVHTSYHQAVTATGRLSSTDPNLQNIPVRGEEGRRIRQAFITQEDYVLISADYSQIELRVMAHLSRDKALLKAFSKGQDIHRRTASEVFNLPLDNVTNEQRRSAKMINFGLIYGMSAFGLSRQLNIPQKESQKYINLYFERYPGVREYMERIRSKAKKKGYVETLEGRRLYLPDIKSDNSAKRAGAERAAINAPMQGTAADIIKHAMIAIDSWLQKEQPRVRMIMQVHDELVFEVHKDEVKPVSKIIHEIMKNSISLDVPLPVEIGSGENWDEATKHSVSGTPFYNQIRE